MAVKIACKQVMFITKDAPVRPHIDEIFIKQKATGPQIRIIQSKEQDLRYR